MKLMYSAGDDAVGLALHSFFRGLELGPQSPSDAMFYPKNRDSHKWKMKVRRVHKPACRVERSRQLVWSACLECYPRSLIYIYTWYLVALAWYSLFFPLSLFRRASYSGLRTDYLAAAAAAATAGTLHSLGFYGPKFGTNLRYRRPPNCCFLVV